MRSWRRATGTAWPPSLPSEPASTRPAWWEKFLYSREERFLFPEECLDLGLVDEVRPPFVLEHGEFAPAAR